MPFTMLSTSRGSRWTRVKASPSSGHENAAGPSLLQRLAQRLPDLRFPRGVAEKAAEVENVGAHGAEQLIVGLLDPGTPAADLVGAVALKDVARIYFSD